MYSIFNLSFNVPLIVLSEFQTAVPPCSRACPACGGLAQAVERLGGRVVERSRAADGAAQGEAWYLWCVWQEGRGSADDLEIQISEADQVIAVRSKARGARFPGFLAAKRQTDRLARLRAAAGLVEVSDPRAAAEGGARD